MLRAGALQLDGGQANAGKLLIMGKKIDSKESFKMPLWLSWGTIWILKLAIQQCSNREAGSTRVFGWEVSSMCLLFVGMVSCRVYCSQYGHTVTLPW